MQAINCRKTSYPKGEGLDYVANGEIGLVVQTSEGERRQGRLDEGPVLDAADRRRTTTPGPMSKANSNSPTP